MIKYPKYKPSDIEWIGEIPEEWEIKKTKYCFKYTTGFTPPTGQNEYYNGEHIWITISDMDQKYLFDSSTKLSNEAIEKFKPEVTPKGSLLFSFKLSVGKVAFAGTDVYTNEAIISIIPNSNINLDYFYYILPNQLLRNSNENIYGAKLLNQELIKNASIIFPSPEEQTAIANFLDDKTAKIDSLIEKKKQLIELLKEERTAVINQAVTKGINPNVKLKPSGIDWLGDIPEHWEVKKLKTISYMKGRIGWQGLKNAEFTMNISDPYLITGMNFKDGEIRWDEVYHISEERFLEAPEIQLRANDVLMTKDGTIGKLLYIDKLPGPTSLNSHLLVLRPLNGEYFPKYLYYQLQSNQFNHFIELNKTGTTFYGITQEAMSRYRMLLPPIEEQQQIAQFVEADTIRVNGTISKIEKEIELLQEYRIALISEVVTGKIKVS